MKLKSCSFLADENIHPALVAYLQKIGCDILTVSRLYLTGKPDIQIIDEAYKQGRIILTHDSDFGTLAVAGHHRFIGIIFIRPGHIRGEFSIETMKTLLALELEFTAGMIIIVQRRDDDIRVRIRNLGE